MLVEISSTGNPLPLLHDNIDNIDIDNSSPDSDTSVDTMSDNLRSSFKETEIVKNGSKEVEKGEEKEKDIEKGKETGKSVNINFKISKVSKEKLKDRNDNSDYDNDDANEDEDRNSFHNENDVDIDVDDNNTEINHYIVQTTV